MLAIRQSAPEHLVVATSQRIEFMGLLFCGLGLLTLMMITVVAVNYKDVYPEAFFVTFMASWVLLPLGLAGIIIVFTQQRFIFVQGAAQVYSKQGLAKDIITKFSDYQYVEVIESKLGTAVVNLITTDGRRVIITRGPVLQAVPLAETISTFTGWQLEYVKKVAK